MIYRETEKVSAQIASSGAVMQRSLRDKNFPRLSDDDDVVYTCGN